MMKGGYGLHWAVAALNNAMTIRRRSWPAGVWIRRFQDRRDIVIYSDVNGHLSEYKFDFETLLATDWDQMAEEVELTKS